MSIWAGVSACVSVGCEIQSTLVTFSRVERHLLVERAAQRVEHPALERAAQRLGIDDQTAVVRADEPLHPDMTRSAVHLDLGDLRHDGLAAVGVRDAATGEDVARCRSAVGDGRASQPYASAAALITAMERARLKPLSSVGAGGEQPQAELDRVGLRRRGQFVDERLGCERHLRTVGIAQVAGPQRRFPHERQADDVRRHPPVRDDVHVRRRGRAAARRRGAPHARELRDQHGVVFVVPEVIVVGGAGVVVERR